MVPGFYRERTAPNDVAVRRAKGRGQRAKVWNELSIAIFPLTFALPSSL